MPIENVYVSYPVRDIQVPPESLENEVLKGLERISAGAGGQNKIPIDKIEICEETRKTLVHINGYCIRVEEEWEHSLGGNSQNIIATAQAFQQAAVKASLDGWKSPDIAHSGSNRIALAIPKGEHLKRTIILGEPYDETSIEAFAKKLGLEQGHRVILDTLVSGMSNKVEQLVVPSSKVKERFKKDFRTNPRSFCGVNGGEAKELLGQNPYEGIDLDDLDQLKNFVEGYLPASRENYEAPTLLHSLELFEGARSVGVFGFGKKRYLCVAPLDFDLSTKFAESLGLSTNGSAYTVGCGDSQVGGKNEVGNLYRWMDRTNRNEHPEVRSMKAAMRLSFAASSAVLRLKNSNLQGYDPEKIKEMILWAAAEDSALPVKILEY